MTATTYAREHDAIADYGHVRATYESLRHPGTFRTTVVSRRVDGKVHIVKSVEEPTRHGVVAGLAARHMSLRDRKDLGERLGRRESGLVVLAPTWPLAPSWRSRVRRPS